MPKLRPQPVKRAELVEAVKEAADIVDEGLTGKTTDSPYRVPAFTMVLRELLDYESDSRTHAK